MTGGPRIIFTRFASSTSPRLAPWREHLRRVTGIPTDARAAAATAAATVAGPAATLAAIGEVIVWQLVSANNRELARSASLFDGFQEAVTAATMAVTSAGELDVCTVNNDRSGLYGWYLTLAGVPTVVCARWYDGERESRKSLQLTVAALPIATRSAGARGMLEHVHGDRVML